MIFVKRGANGEVIAVSREPLANAESREGGWSAVSGDEAEVLAFSRIISDAANPLESSDLSLVRVLEDLIELLIERSVIRFTDLPSPAQQKLMERRGAREALQRISLLDDDGVI
ncbi:hypothetical protein GPA25_03685 [Aromatoleum diolicum]|uniref:Tryptophan synthase subunit beta like protein n=2 Tax=Aromatoleum diolicum TaxID=75796 RepID=A0ABX1Q656_9RHOO|nr:hypothetical protein [Aromatoleum diolicum]